MSFRRKNKKPEPRDERTRDDDVLKRRLRTTQERVQARLRALEAELAVITRQEPRR